MIFLLLISEEKRTIFVHVAKDSKEDFFKLTRALNSFQSHTILLVL